MAELHLVCQPGLPSGGGHGRSAYVFCRVLPFGESVGRYREALRRGELKLRGVGCWCRVSVPGIDEAS